MKQVFSNSWKSSKQTRKQRKYRANAPLHILSKMISGHLSKTLRQKYNTRSISVRTGDEVKVMKGKFKGKTGKIAQVNIKKQKVTIDGLQNKKKDGTKINAYFDASNLQVEALKDDKRRFKRMKSKQTPKPEVKKETTVNAKPDKKSETKKVDTKVNKTEDKK